MRFYIWEKIIKIYHNPLIKDMLHEENIEYDSSDSCNK